jgi:hypothetical protein
MKNTVKIVIVIAILLAIYFWYNKRYSVAAKKEAALIDDAVQDRIADIKDAYTSNSNLYCDLKAAQYSSTFGMQDAVRNACRSKVTELRDIVIDWQLYQSSWDSGQMDYPNSVGVNLYFGD